jgi:hypothetical protein
MLSRRRISSLSPLAEKMTVKQGEPYPEALQLARMLQTKFLEISRIYEITHRDPIDLERLLLTCVANFVAP